MRLSFVVAILLAMAAGGAEAPPAPAPDAWAPDARLFYESDTRAYYRPCG
jgi:hypothetical protein